MTVKVQKWGNSCGIRIPKIVLDELRVKEGDSMDIKTNSNEIILSKKMTVAERMNEFNEEYIPKEYFESSDVGGKELW